MLLAELPALLADSDFQAGGGGSFGGGGSSGGGRGGGGGGGGGEILYILIRLAFAYPAIGVPLLIVFVIFLLKSQRGIRSGVQGRTIRKHQPLVRERRAQASVARLQSNDPDFDTQAFLNRVRIAFRKAQDSWCNQDLEPLRPFVSDGVYERFTLQIDEQKRDGWRQGMSGTRISQLQVANVETGGQFDSITVRIGFDSEINRLRLSDGKVVPGSLIPTNRFHECWTFVRRKGTKSLSGKGLIEGQCPNCGATLEMNQSSRCGQCGCLARSGQFDWVLVEITQASEWRPEGERALPGFAELSNSDPGLSVAMLEDRVSVAFWRKCAADRAGEVEVLARVASDELLEEYARDLKPDSKGVRHYLSECAVGSVRTLGFVIEDRDEHALVEIVWDGRATSENSKGKRKLDPRRTRQRSVFVMTRRSGSQTKLKDSFTTMFCTSCGAHDEDSIAPHCPYCGAPRRGDRSVWVASRILAARGPEWNSWSARLDGASRDVRDVPRLSRPSADGLLTWAVAVVKADGQVTPVERRGLRELARHLEVPDSRVEELLEAEGQEDLVPVADDVREVRAWLDHLLEQALADGKVQPQEWKLLKHVAKGAGVKKRELELLLREARRRLFDEARDARRESRKRVPTPAQRILRM